MAPRFVGHALVAVLLLAAAVAAQEPPVPVLTLPPFTGDPGLPVIATGIVVGVTLNTAPPVATAPPRCAGDAKKPYLCPDGTCAKELQNCPCVNAARVSATSVAPRTGATGVAGELDVGVALEFAAVAAFRGDSGRCAAVDFAPLTRLAFTVTAVGAAGGPLATISDVPASSQGASVATFAPGVFAAGTRYTVTATYTDLKGRASSASYTFLGVAVTTTTSSPVVLPCVGCIVIDLGGGGNIFVGGNVGGLGGADYTGPLPTFAPADPAPATP